MSFSAIRLIFNNNSPLYLLPDTTTLPVRKRSLRIKEIDIPNNEQASSELLSKFRVVHYFVVDWAFNFLFQPLNLMKLKKIFGSLLTVLGAVTLLYAAYIFITSKTPEWRTLIVCSVIGLLFFSSGIGLIKGLKDEN
mgnify:CR=1 FL=1